MEVLVIVLACLLLNAILAAAEMAFVAVGRPELRAYASKGSKRARILLNLREKPERILSVLQIGISLVGAVAAAVSGAGANQSFGPWLQSYYQVSESTAEIIAIILIVIPLTYFNVVFGELVPKAISLKRPLTIALASAPWLRLFDQMLSPIVSLLEKSTKLVIRRMFKAHQETPVNKEDILELNELNDQTRQYILSMIRAEKKSAQEIMVPWAAAFHVRRDDPIEKIETVILECHHTRLPVMSGADVVGLIHSKEILKAIEQGRRDWQGFIRNMVRVRLREPILEIFLKLQKQRSHMAVVYDRMDVVGIVTFEDIIEEIMGEMYEEHDENQTVRSLLSHRNKVT